MTDLRIRSLTVRYGRGRDAVVPVADLDLDVASGEMVLLVGPSGCGKTTLVSCLAGMLTPLRGSIEVGGVDVTRLRGRRLTAYRRRHCGIVFQSFNLIASLTALENVAVSMRCAGMRWRDARSRASALLEKVHLEAHACQRPGDLSGGQQQRVAIARALGSDPPLLLADEPTAHLDDVQAEGVIRLLRELARPGRIVIVSTHDDRLRPYADRVIDLTGSAVVAAPVPRQVAVQRGRHRRFPVAAALAGALAGVIGATGLTQTARLAAMAGRDATPVAIISGAAAAPPGAALGVPAADHANAGESLSPGVPRPKAAAPGSVAPVAVTLAAPATNLPAPVRRPLAPLPAATGLVSVFPPVSLPLPALPLPVALPAAAPVTRTFTTLGIYSQQASVTWVASAARPIQISYTPLALACYLGAGRVTGLDLYQAGVLLGHITPPQATCATQVSAIFTPSSLVPPEYSLVVRTSLPGIPVTLRITEQ